MSGSQPSATRAGSALALLGDHWTLQILQRVFTGERRYHQIRQAIHASDSVLADRLKTLVEGGLLVRVPYKDGRTRYEYHLSRSGQDTWRIFVAAWVWEREWFERPSGQGAELVHARCGRSTVPQLICGACGLPVTARDTSVRNMTGSLRYGGVLPRRHIQSRTLQRRDAYSFLPQTLELMGDRWNMALMAAAAIGIRRFSDFERFLGTPPTVLSARLTRFLELGMLRVQESSANGRTDYRLTDKGRSFSTVLLHLVHWADEHVAGDEASSIDIQHDACGSRLAPEYRCGECGQRMRLRDVRFAAFAAAP